MLTQGDCLSVLPTLEEGSVDLIYADPPFNSGRDYAGQSGEFRDTWSSMAAYLDFMRARLEAMARVLSPRGSIYLHCDDTAARRLGCLLDEVFGVHAYSATITWHRSNSQSSVSKKWGRMTDTIYHYARNGAPFNPVWLPYSPEYMAAQFYRNDNDGRGPYSPRYPLRPRGSASGYRYKWKGYRMPANGWSIPIEKMRELEADNRLWEPKKKDGTPDGASTVYLKKYLSDSRGVLVGNLWTDIKGMTGPHREFIDYPTQKPLALLERIVAASSNSGDFVFDPFMGSGTTLVAAKRLGRRYAGCDVSADALAVAAKRLEQVEPTLC